MKNLKKIWRLGIIFLGLVSCAEDSIESNDLQNGNELKFVPAKGADPEFNIENGVFNFSSSEAAFATVNYFNSLSTDDLLKWSEEHNFVTQKVLFEQVIKEEIKLYDGFEKMSEIELKGLKPDQYHSPIYKKMLEKNVIKEVFNDAGELDEYTYAVCNPFIAGILNKDGVYKVRDDIVYVDGKYMKMWKNGNLAELDELKTVTESDSLKGIEILYNTSQTKLRTFYGPESYEPIDGAQVYTNNQNVAVDKDNGATRRYFLRVFFVILEWNTGSNGFKYLHYANFISQKKKTILGMSIEMLMYIIMAIGIR